MTVAGDLMDGVPITVLLYEGDIVRATGEGRTGLESPVVTRAAPLAVGSFVEIMDDAAATYENTGGLPVVKGLASTGAVLLGKIIAIDRAKAIPAGNGTVSSVATMISQGLLRRATVIFYGLRNFEYMAVKVLQNKGNCTAGNAANIAYDLSEEMFVASSDISSGKGAVPLHRVTGSSTAAVTGYVLMGYTGEAVLVQA